MSFLHHQDWESVRLSTQIHIVIKYQLINDCSYHCKTVRLVGCLTVRNTLTQSSFELKTYFQMKEISVCPLSDLHHHPFSDTVYVIQPFLYALASSGVAADLAITLTLCLLLMRSRTGFERCFHTSCSIGRIFS